MTQSERTAARLAIALALALALAGPGAAGAQEAADDGTQHGPVGLLVHAGVFQGFGGGLQLGTETVGVRGSVAWMPHLFALDRGGGSTDLEFRSALLLSPDLYVRVLHPRPRTHVGLEAGYRYSSLLGSGVAAGFYVQFGIGPRWLDALVTGGVLVFPNGEDRAREELNQPFANFRFPGPAVNVGATVGLAFFP